MFTLGWIFGLLIHRGKLRDMKSYKYITQQHNGAQYKSTNTNIVQLIKHAKEQENKEKRKNIYMAAAAISVLALSGFIISQ